MIKRYTDQKDVLFAAVGCVCFSGNMILVLKRNIDKSYPDHWGIPTGKVEIGETLIKAIIRELFEETKLVLSEERLTVVDDYYVSNDDMAFSYALFYTEFEINPNVSIDITEHSQHQWLEISQIDSLKLVPHVKETVQYAIQRRALKLSSQLNLFTNRPDVLMTNVVDLMKYMKDYPPLEFNSPEMKSWIVTFGSPGSGKTTTLKSLFNSIPNSKYSLISDNSKILKKNTRLKRYFIEAMKNRKFIYFFYFQMEILADKYIQSLSAPQNALVDETIFSTLAYSLALFRLNWLTQDQFETFLYNYQIYSSYLPKPDFVLFFYCRKNSLVKRIAERNRKIEKYFTIEYIEALNYAFQDVGNYLEGIGHKVIYIDTEELRTTSIVSDLLSNILKDGFK
ncbi:NUDIX domain-containing protein [Pedobacter sp. N23S346]|uniref:NUDIX domain-containing protein n=1 Tax=Pedobacter sp. N23S346 TaxID=3402750 RepID=UPI003ACABD26